MEWKKLTAFALLCCFLGFALNFVIFSFGYVALLGNVFLEQDPGWICKSLEAGSVNHKILNSFCEFGYGQFTTFPTTMIAIFYMFLNGLLWYGLIKKKLDVIYAWQIVYVLSSFALFFAHFYVSYLLISDVF